MKVRNGFVSNSSSSSFCIYGFEASMPEADEAIDILKKIKKDNPDFFNSMINKKIDEYKELCKIENYYNSNLAMYELIANIDDEEILSDDETKNKLEDFLSDDADDFYSLLGLSYHNMDYSCYAGRDWSSVRDDETGLQFKQSVEAIAKYLTKSKCSTIEEAWYDG
jgi:hypothetical protein